MIERNPAVTSLAPSDLGPEMNAALDALVRVYTGEGDAGHVKLDAAGLAAELRLRLYIDRIRREREMDPQERRDLLGIERRRTIGEEKAT